MVIAVTTNMFIWRYAGVFPLTRDLACLDLDALRKLLKEYAVALSVMGQPLSTCRYHVVAYESKDGYGERLCGREGRWRVYVRMNDFGVALEMLCEENAWLTEEIRRRCVKISE